MRILAPLLSLFSLACASDYIGANPVALGSFDAFPVQAGVVVTSGVVFQESQATLVALNSSKKARFHHKQGFESYDDVTFTVGHEPEEPTAMEDITYGDASKRRQRMAVYSSSEVQNFLPLKNGVKIARKPVTNKEYYHFIVKTGHRTPKHWEKGTFANGRGDFPVVNVSYEDAQAFARWSEKRLPTYNEWMSAADQLSWDMEMPENEWTSSIAGAEQVVVGKDENLTSSMVPTMMNEGTGFRLVSDP